MAFRKANCFSDTFTTGIDPWLRAGVGSRIGTATLRLNTKTTMAINARIAILPPLDRIVEPTLLADTPTITIFHLLCQ